MTTPKLATTAVDKTRAPLRVALCTCTLLALVGEAAASPWTLLEDTLVLTTSMDAQTATNEYLSDGTFQAYPIEGRYFSTNLRFGLRFGVSDRLEIGGQTALSYLSYESAEAYFAPAPDDAGSLSDIRAGILSFDRQVAGLSDVFLYTRYRLTPRQRFVAALELTLKLPTGYQATTGPFASTDEPGDYLGDGSELVDDLSLGDGQLDVTGQVLLGWAPPGGWFLRLDAGARARFFGPGPQVVGAFKLGRRVTDGLVPYLDADVVHTFLDGEVVGQVLTTDEPETPATEFDLDRVVIRDQRFDRSVLRVGAGFIFTIGDRELDLGYYYTPWGRNTAALHVFSLGTSFLL
jgi:hypothetical protein